MKKQTIGELINDQSADAMIKKLDFIKHMFDPLYKVFEEIGKTFSILANFFEKTIYLNPELYGILARMNLAISPKKLKAGLKSGKYKEENIYVIYTLVTRRSKVHTLHFSVTKKVAQAIKTLIKNDPQFMYYKAEKLLFDSKKSELIINGTSIPINPELPMYDLCKYMFEENKTRKASFGLRELITAIGERPEDDRDWYRYIYDRIRNLNEKIENYTGYEKFILRKNKCFIINPLYIIPQEK